MEVVHDAKRLAELQALPLERKIQISQARIIEWYRHYNGNVVVSFSGGKDSTVLLHLVRSVFPDVRAVFSNTGLEYPEIQRHVRGIENVDIVVPSMRFDQVISTYGYPLIGKEVAEAIYYARRIRSQSVNVERERGKSGETQPCRCTSGKEPSLPGDEVPANSTPRAIVTERLQNRGGDDRPSESVRNSQCQTAEKSSHRDEHCTEQENSVKRDNGKQRDFKRGELGGARSTVRTRTGMRTIRGRDGGTNSEGSKPG